MTGVFIAGVAMTSLGRHINRTVKELTREAVEGALADAGATTGDVEAAWFSNTRQGLMEKQNSIRGQIALRAAGIEGIPITNVENACASSSTGMHAAYSAILAGMCDVTLVVGAEKMIYPDVPKEDILSAFLGGTDITEIEKSQALFQSLLKHEDKARVSQDRRSFFMDMYAAMARRHMDAHGTTLRQLAAIAAKNHRHSVNNPLSHYRVDMTIEQVLNDQPIIWPLTRSMCAPVSDGAAALLLCSRRGLANLRAHSRAIAVRSVVLLSGTAHDLDDEAHNIGRRAAAQAYEIAGIGPEDVNVAEVHDATVVGEILQTENLRLCEPGEGGPMAERGETSLGGRLPVNPSGGLVSKGHPIAATGAIQLFELVSQLRGESGARQVEGARIAIAENGGGFLGVEEAAATVTILEKSKFSL